MPPANLQMEPTRLKKAFELTFELYFTDAMAKPYDVAFRGRAVAAYEAGEGGYHELAEVFGLGYRTLQRWVAQYRATESIAPRPRGADQSDELSAGDEARAVRP